MPFNDLQLDAKLLRAVEASGFSEPTEIQSRAIPVALEGRDLMASAHTGTGKTAAFVLPALQRLLQTHPAPGYGPRVLVLTPTRELAAQVSEAVRDLGRFAGLRSGVIVGGAPYFPQERLLRQALDILVATPGRLIDHMQRGRLDLSRVELLVLDEADRMLDMGFIDAVEQIAAAAPKTRQTLLFSATLEGAVNDVARRLLREPARVQIAGVRERHTNITQHVHQADDLRHKQALLKHLIKDPDISQAIIFTATKRDADRLALALSDHGHACAALHGDMNQGQRNRTVDRLRRGHIKLLVATDVAARGLDVKGITHVINFDLPGAAEDYVHRIGRTGRAGAMGTAVSLVGPDDWHKLSRIERLTGQRLDRHIVAGLEPSRSAPRPGRGDQGKPQRKPWQGRSNNSEARTSEQRRGGPRQAPRRGGPSGAPRPRG